MTDTQLAPDYKTLISSLAPEGEHTITVIDIPSFPNEKEAETASQWLTSTECEQLGRYSFKKRRNEWLSGRICVKQAVLEHMKNHNGNGQANAHDFAIESSHTGRPFVIFKNPSEHPEVVEISISHSHGKAAAMAGKALCGIDIQLLNNTLFKVRDRYCTDVEAAIMDEIPADELVHLGMLWVAKEAVRKCLSGIKLTGFQEMTLTQVNETNGFYLLHFLPTIDGITLHETDHITVATDSRDSYALGVCTIAKGKINAGTA